jgi:hypothetical protein
MTRRSCRVLLVLVPAFTVCAGGCGDPVYTTRQLVELKVAYSATKTPAANATIEAVPRYHERWRRELPVDERRRAWFERAEPARCRTDEFGRASLLLEVHSICGGFYPGVYPGFDSKKDRVTGVPYLLRVFSSPCEEIVDVAMSPGVTSRGNCFEIYIDSIGKPISAGAQPK